MPKKDSCHEQVVIALRKAAWSVNLRAPFLTDEFENDAYIDIEATQGTNGNVLKHIFVEIKCFPEKKDTAAFQRAIGQYILYRTILDNAGLYVPLYLAVPSETFAVYFNQVTMTLLVQYQIKLVVIDLVREEIVRWIEQ